jgi:hypothetical protein
LVGNSKKGNFWLGDAFWSFGKGTNNIIQPNWLGFWSVLATHTQWRKGSEKQKKRQKKNMGSDWKWH